MNFLADKKVNTGRQKELDIAKTLAVIFMILCHVIVFASFSNILITPEFELIFNQAAAIIVAPVFMFCMGIGIIFSRHNQYNLLIKRGVQLLLLGYFVNIGTQLIPNVLGHMLNTSNAPIAVLSLFKVDILVFAGVAFILIGILKRFNFSKEKMLILAIVLSIIGSFVCFVDFNNVFLNYFFGYFIGTILHKCTAFPLFNWFIFPVAGMVYGSYFIRAKDKSQFFKLWPVFLIVPLIFILCTLSPVPAGSICDNARAYFITTFDAIVCIILIHGLLGFFWKISEFLPDMLSNGFTTLSKHVTGIYVAQWYFIPLFMTFIEYFYKGIVFTDLSIILISIFILVISTLAALLYSKYKQTK
ncbi:heparan-alpha-glucosaminide N-acetyltransferase domain-containing protein [Methanobrevibacter sp.]|uniref:heparan-alpha-glucosaminide N-acetyltransferase domain-containing protein n=1 Tax=Methanobrevibacter sp. TaxID=66852 RepID=UPI00388DEBE5